MDSVPLDLAERYQSALEQYLAEGNLQRAFDFGCHANGSGATVSELARAHHLAALQLLSTQQGPAKSTLKACCDFFLQVLAGFDRPGREYERADALLRRINEAMESEAKRIAHALHDEAGQLLTVVHLKLEDAVQQVPAGCRTCLGEIRTLLHQIEDQLRRVSHELRPTILEDLGLVPAVEFLAEGIAKRSGMEIRVAGAVPQRPEVEVEATVYRVVQEALTNAAKHAQATETVVSFRDEGGSLVCEIRDNGCGFDADAASRRQGRGLGLVGMQERLAGVGGVLVIESRPLEGTVVLVSVPLRDCPAGFARAASQL